MTFLCILFVLSILVLVVLVVLVRTGCRTRLFDRYKHVHSANIV